MTRKRKPTSEKTVAEHLRDAARKRRPGSSGFFHWPNKRTKEFGIVTCFIEAMALGPKIQKINHVDVDPPDCELLLHDGSQIGVEITELVDQAAIERASKTKHHDDWADWSESKIRSALEKIVARKDNLRALKGKNYTRYMLLIHSDEPMLRIEANEQLFSRLEFSTHLIDEIYLLLSYDPKIQNYPVFPIATKRAT